MGTDLALAVCGGGGNDTVAIIVVLAIAALYLLAVGAALNRAEDGTERAKLLGLLVIAVVVGGIVFRGLAGISGFGDFLGRLMIALVITSAITLVGVARQREGSAGRAVFVAVAGTILIPFGVFILFFAAVGLGTGCLD
jgi:hypothetical protein